MSGFSGLPARVTPREREMLLAFSKQKRRPLPVFDASGLVLLDEEENVWCLGVVAGFRPGLAFPIPSLESEEELATVLAALRFYQLAGMGDPVHRRIQSEEIHEIATADGSLTSLSEDGIVALYERLNKEEVAHAS